MKSGTLKEWYGRRFTPLSNILSILLIIAFGVCLALAPNPGNDTGHKSDMIQSIKEIE